MKNIYWLIRRELWEHKVEMIWAPIATAVLLVGIAVLWVISLQSLGGGGIVINDLELGNSRVLTAEETDALFSTASTGLYYIAFLIAGLAGFVIANYCAHALYTERKDRSILFWKSLPVTDLETVLAKVALALLIAPLIAVAVALVAMALVSGVASIGLSGAESGEELQRLIARALVQVGGNVLASLPIQLIWMIPSVGWFMLVSAVARSNPWLWGVAVPLTVLFLKEAAVLLFQVDPSEWYFLSTVRWIAGTFPASWYLLDTVTSDRLAGNGAEYLRQLWSIFNWMPYWIGTGFGGALIYLSIQARRRIV